MNRKFFSVATALCMSMSVTSASAELKESEFQDAMQKYLASEKGREALGKAIETYARDAQAKAQEEEFEQTFKNPVKIDPGNSPSKGPADAKITIVEFSDFECPFCKRGADNMDQLLKLYPKDVRLVFKHLPLPMHRNAKPAAKASAAAAKQGKFWEFHDELFKHQQSLNEDFFLKTAEKLGLDMAKFKADIASSEIEKMVEEDTKIASTHGIQGTPGFFVNGVPVRGAYPVEHFQKIIDKLLEKK